MLSETVVVIINQSYGYGKKTIFYFYDRLSYYLNQKLRG